MLRMVVALTLALGLSSLPRPVFAQPKNLDPNSNPKGAAGKVDPKFPSDKTESKMPMEKKEPKDSTPKAAESKDRLPLGKWKLPPGAVVVVVEEIQEALAQLTPKLVLLSAEEYQKLVDRLAKLESQLKAEKGIVASCKMTGKVEGEHLVVKAAVTLVSMQARAPVLLGFGGAQLSEETELDKQMPWLEATEEGFVARADREGVHQLNLVFKIPLQERRLPIFVGGPERGFELNLPGAAVTTLNLELPDKIQEIRFNDLHEKTRVNGRFELALGKVKQVQVSWKEPASVSGAGPLLIVDSQINVRLEDHQALIQADMTLEDLRGRTKEWQLQLPAKAQVEIKSPRGQTVEIVAPDDKTPLTRLRLSEATADKIVLQVQAQAPRPFANDRLAVGPFLVVGAFRHQGVVAVQAPPESLRGQRLVFHRHGETYPRETAKNAAPSDRIALFHFWNLGTAGAKAKAVAGVPLEIDFKTDKGKLECSTDHVLRLKQQPEGWQLEMVTRFRMKAAYAGTEAVEIQMPPTRMPVLERLVPPLAPATNPGTWPWSALLSQALEEPAPWPVELFWEQETGPPPQWHYVPGQRRVLIKLARPQGKDFTLVLTGRYWLELGTTRADIELPRPLGMFDRGGKVSLTIDEPWELFVGRPGAEAPVSANHQYQEAWDSAPARLSCSWKPHQMPMPASSVVDVILQDRLARVRQHLVVGLPRRSGKAGGDAIRFRLPAEARQIKLLSGGEWRQEGDIGWVLPSPEGAGKADLVFEYGVNWPGPEGGVKPSVSIPLLWPEAATDRQGKVRVWGSGRHWPVFHADAAGSDWALLGAEPVADKESLPALVLAGSGDAVSLRASNGEFAHADLAGWLCERGLIQVIVDDEGGHHYRVRFYVRKWSAPHLDIELPLPVLQCLQSVAITHKEVVKDLPWFPLDTSPRVARIPIDPAYFAEAFILELKYNLPASFTQDRRFWLTTFYPPSCKGESLPSRLRWQFSLQSAGVVFPLEKDVAVDFRWGWHGWLLGPESSVTAEELEEWLTQRDAPDTALPVSLAMWRPGPATLTLLHFPRQFWLLLCSGVFLTGALALYAIPWPRWFRWLLLLLLALASLAAILFWPAWTPALFLGLQPGLVVVLILAGIHRVLHDRYRRQLVFLPGFSRTKSGSSLTRSSNRPIATIPANAPAPPIEGTPLVGSEPKI